MSADPVALAPPEAAPERVAREWRPVVGAAALVLAMVVYARVLTVASGGRDDNVLTWGLLSLLPALLVIPPRPGRRGLKLGAVALGAAALLVCWLSPYGFTDGRHAASFTYAGLLTLLVYDFATSRTRQLAVAAALCLVSLDQFCQAFLPWWGGEDPTKEMFGTFYWHNQFAVFLLPGVILGGFLAVHGPRLFKQIGWVSVPLCATGIVLSTSRATMLLAAVGLAALLLSAVQQRAGRWRRGACVLALVGLCVLGPLLFTSKLFFAHPGSAFGATDKRAAAGESVGTNAGYRLDFMRAGLHVGAEHPLSGAGFGSFGDAIGPHLAPGATRSSAAHNELVQAWSDGGALLAFPVLLCMLGAAWLALGAIVRARRSVGPGRAIGIGAAVAALALLAHALVDFDWSFPSLLGLLGVLLALAAASGQEGANTPPAPRGRAVRARAVALLALLLAAAVAVSGDAASAALTRLPLDLADKGATAEAKHLLQVRSSLFPNPDLDAAILRVSQAKGFETLLVPAASARRALAATADLGRISTQVESARIGVLYSLGDKVGAEAMARRLADTSGRTHPVDVHPLAEVLNVTGRRAQAEDLLATTVESWSEGTRGSVEGQLNELMRALARISGKETVRLRCTVADFVRAFGVDKLEPELRLVSQPSSADACSSTASRGVRP